MAGKGGDLLDAGFQGARLAEDPDFVRPRDDLPAERPDGLIANEQDVDSDREMLWTR